MSLAYNIILKLREDEGDTFTISSGITGWSFDQNIINGCGQLRFSVYRSSWSSGVLAYFQPDNIVSFVLQFSGGALTPWTGVLRSIPGSKNLPASARLHREFSAVGCWDYLTDPGVKVLNVYNALTIQNVVKALVTNDIAPYCDISATTTNITAGSGYTLGRAIYIDKNAGDCIKQLAEVEGDVVYGVGADRLVYFKPKVASGAAAALSFQLGVKADGVSSFAQTFDDTKRANYIVVNGRDRRGGSPMSVAVYDPELDTPGTSMRTMMRVLSAPEHATGSDLYKLATYHLADLNRSVETAKLVVEAADTKLTNPLLLPDGVNVNVEVKDEGGAAIGKWPAQTVGYELVSGSCRMTFGLGDRFGTDILDALNLRDIMREVGVFSATELLNAVELKASQEGWEEWAYRELVRLHKMRCSWRANLESDTSALILQEPGYYSVTRYADPPGVTGSVSSQYSAAAITVPIRTGVARNIFCALRDLQYPILRGGAMSDAGEAGFAAIDLDLFETTSTLPVTWETNDKDEIRPRFKVSPAGTKDHYGVLLLNRPVSWRCDYIYEFRWGTPVGEDGKIRRKCIFGWYDEDNYWFVQFHEDLVNHRIWSKLYQVIGGTPVETGAAAGWLAVSNDDVIRLTVNAGRSLYSPGGIPSWGLILLIENVTKGTSRSWASDDEFSSSVPGQYVGFGIDAQDMAAMHGDGKYDKFYVRSLTFANCTFADGSVETSSWQVSRDGGNTWEREDVNTPGLYFSPDDQTTAIDLGDYAGGYDAEDYVVLRVRVAFPQVLRCIALGFK